MTTSQLNEYRHQLIELRYSIDATHTLADTIDDLIVYTAGRLDDMNMAGRQDVELLLEFAAMNQLNHRFETNDSQQFAFEMVLTKLVDARMEMAGVGRLSALAWVALADLEDILALAPEIPSLQSD